MAIDALEQTEKFQNFFETHYTSELHEISSKGKRSLTVDFFELSKFDVGLSEELLEDPDETVRASEAAVELLGFKARVRFKNFPDSQHIFIRNIRKNHISKFIAIQGIIRQSSDVRPEAVYATYECPSCGGKLKILQTDTKLREPSRCSCGRKGHFKMLSKDLVDVQRLVIEEAPQTLDGGAQPKRLSVFLREDLVEPIMEKRTTPGTNVKITGVLREIPIPHKLGGIMTRFELSMDSNHIEPVEEDFSDIIINQEEVDKIKKLAKSKRVYEMLINSIAPSIYGNENVKLALGLQMLGGVKKKKKDGTMIRGDMHILLVGDPGVAKSQMVTFISKVAPKARYVAGRGASGAGLTATVVKDDFLRGWALEAGAMVLADKGVLCLDEMDKMSVEDTSALHEAMEQQQISIAKANVQATLRAETSILAAANPKFGRFDPFAHIGKQINLPPALINRFDLIFVLRDLPSKDVDSKIAKHMLMNQSDNGVESELDPRLLRKWIAYAKQNIHPKLTDEAKTVIENFYVNLRNAGPQDEALKAIPITPRQLEAIIRLAEASAKLKLADKVTKQDAEKAIKLQIACMEQIGIDPETGKMDIDRITTGVPSSERGRIVSVREIIFELSDGKKTIPVEEIMEEAEKKGIPRHKVDESIEKLKRSGDIYEPKKGFIEKI
ncbi:MAG: minichromosome maintenance protein MCM [Nanoarchaeota archaeon]|nr:minichromosome maintenance protein MCM [Nanoarchaeota archaeon]MBU4352353.1 minichromosome maintenance protein MCM [Nanoarchaeota archaeon]